MDSRNWIGFKWKGSDGDKRQVVGKSKNGGWWIYARFRNGAVLNKGVISGAQLAEHEGLGRHLDIPLPGGTPRRMIASVTPLPTITIVESPQASVQGVESEMAFLRHEYADMTDTLATALEDYGKALGEIDELKRAIRDFLHLQIGVHRDRLYELIGEQPPQRISVHPVGIGSEVQQ